MSATELKTVRYFEDRAAKANPEDLKRILAKAGTLPPREGDEIPKGWLEDVDPERENAPTRKP